MRKYLVFALVVLLVAGLATAAVAEGKSNVGRLTLYEKDPDGWSIVDGGASGSLRYNLRGPRFNFSFHGHGLEPDTDYSLIYYADPWPGNDPGAFLRSATTNKKGDINFGGSVELDMDLPSSPDQNYPGGAKIWLVLTSDWNNFSWTLWRPTEYLFENNLITYDDTDVPAP